jgi:hypothetical protein
LATVVDATKSRLGDMVEDALEIVEENNIGCALEYEGELYQ